jgi:hypothetical protein
MGVESNFSAYDWATGTLRLETTYHQPGGDPVKKQTLSPKKVSPSPISLDTLARLAILFAIQGCELVTQSNADPTA